MLAVLNQEKRFFIFIKDVSTGVPLPNVSQADLNLSIKRYGQAPEAITLVDGVSFNEIWVGVYEVVLEGSYLDTEGVFLFHSSESVIGSNTTETVLQMFEVVPQTQTMQGMAESLSRVLGLVQENTKIHNHLYDSNGNLIQSEIVLYPSQSDLIADTNPIASYTMLASYDGSGNVVTYEVRKS